MRGKLILKKKRKLFVSTIIMMMICCLVFCVPTEAATVKRPVRVTNVKAIVTDCNSAKITWKKQSSTGYKVYRSTKKETGYKLVKTTSLNEWKNTGLSSGKKYYYKVKAYNKSGKTIKLSSEYSQVVSVTPKVGKPSNLKISKPANRTLKIKWDTAKYATGYQVYRSTSKNGKYTKVRSTKATSFENSDLKPEITYYYKVRAYCKKNDKYYYSLFSDIISGRPRLAKPTGISAKIENGNIRLKWNTVSGTSKYYVYRSDGKVFSTSKNSYLDEQVKLGVKYRYRVRAYRSTYSNYSAYTSYIKVCSKKVETVIEDAVLYSLDDKNILEYDTLYDDVVYSDADILGCDINSLKELDSILGTPDSPKVKFGTEVGNRTLGKLVIADLGYNSDKQIVRIEVESISERPVVGITWRKDSIPSGYKRYAEIFERNGAYTVYLPKVQNTEEAREVLSNINGIFFTGGEGWNPKWYGEVQTPHGSNVWNAERDISDMSLLKQSIEMDVPMLVVCRNLQGLNVALGGGLIQDIPYYLGQRVKNGEVSVNRVTKVLSGKLESIGANVADEGYPMYDSEQDIFVETYNAETGEYVEESGCKEGHLRVEIDGINHDSTGIVHGLEFGEDNQDFVVSKNSKWLYDILKMETVPDVATSHHQAVNPERLGEGLTIVAKSSDGIVEAVEYQKNLFALGLQWHPEKFLLNNTPGINQETCNAPMRALVEYARIHKERE